MALSKTSPRLAVAVLLLTAGCANKEPDVESGQPPEVLSEPGYHVSWGHLGRSGAAMRKPSYEHVLGSPELLESSAGRLAFTGATSQPVAAKDTDCVDPNNTINQQEGAGSVIALATGAGSISEYIRVRNKLCNGKERLTYEEWEVLVEGTPRDVPSQLKPRNN